jgi:PAS domain S-box-containing protein
MNSRASATDRLFWTDTDDEVARRRYRDLLDTLEEGVFLLDSDGQFLAVNDAFVTTTGYARDELLGEHVSLLLSPDALGRLEREIDRQRGSLDASPVELAVQTASGMTMACAVRVNPLSNDRDSQETLGIVRRDR